MVSFIGLVGDFVWFLFIWPRSGWMGSKVRLYFNKEPWCPRLLDDT